MIPVPGSRCAFVPSVQRKVLIDGWCRVRVHVLVVGGADACRSIGVGGSRVRCRPAGRKSAGRPRCAADGGSQHGQPPRPPCWAVWW
ncbi:hypothetical protein HBB16_16875 [Pseudonocardia sp. MCCB 268]|nr:hypothetical protein [Pseudonocardia cytotoxica]